MRTQDQLVPEARYGFARHKQRLDESDRLGHGQMLQFDHAE